MYTRFSTTAKDFVARLLNGTALPTGSDSPFRLNKDVFATLQTAGENGAECELVSVSPTVSGGQWVDDSNATRQGYIGNFGCRVKIGANVTFANLDVATVLQMQMNGGKTTVVLKQPMKDGEPVKTGKGDPVYNIVAKQAFVIDLKDAKQVEALNSIAALSEKPAELDAQKSGG